MEKTSLFSFSSFLSRLIFFVWLYSFCLSTPFVSCKCLEDQKSLLLEFKNNLTFDDSWNTTDKLSGWKQSTDCCQWSGVECDGSNGRVIGLDLSDKDISGGIDNSSSLFQLQFLQRLNLAYNDMQGEIPSAFGKLTSLTHLNLSYVDFSGQVPFEISQLVKLVVLDISFNNELYMKKPNLARIIRNMTNLKELYLDGVNSSAMGNRWCHALSSSLPHLEVLSMSYCDLRGAIHKSLSNLNHLSVINLDDNANLSGPIPEFIADFANLTSLSVAFTSITGTVPQRIFHIPTLRTLDLSWNSKLQETLPEFSKNGSLEDLSLRGINFSSPLTSSITNLKRLRFLDLANCQFHGSIPSSIGNLNRLEWLSLAQNQFEGLIPKSIFQLKELQCLDLSSNRLTGTLQLAPFLLSFNKLTLLSLSNNALSINTDGCSVNSSFPQLYSLQLASCNLHLIPEFLKNQTQLEVLDLSMNHITGTIPRWIWRFVNQLNLSNNHFVKLEPPLTPSFIYYIDLHSNNLQGKFPVLLKSHYLDCSRNNFTSFHLDFDNFTDTGFISFSRNSLYGSIPTSLCNATYLEVLNLEYNHLGGTISDCLLAMPNLYVLNLKRNNLIGDIPDMFKRNCSLQTLQVNENFLQGKIPPSLAHCRPLKVLDLGYNQLYDTFPCHLKSLPNLHVLILRSNNFHGTMNCIKGRLIWPLLQIVDLASNHFSGDLSTLFLFKWKSMMIGDLVMQSKPEHLESSASGLGFGYLGYYQNSVAITTKGLSYDLQYILTIFSSIDISNNAFHGALPTELGNLNALKVLNLSHNFLSGHIPPSLGKLSQVESLDLSCNAFRGKIPPQLANLNFLGYLNLSYNKLSGKIPTGTQLQTFGVASYEGNQGLYGPPLPDSGLGTTPSSSSKGSSWSTKDQLEWMLMGAEVGIPVGITIFLGPLLYITRYREWYCKLLHRLVLKILRKEDGPRGRTRSRQLRHRR